MTLPVSNILAKIKVNMRSKHFEADEEKPSKKDGQDYILEAFTTMPIYDFCQDHNMDKDFLYFITGNLLQPRMVFNRNIFMAGVGGDGFANLLEHSSNVEPADGKLGWRIHYNVGAQTKFYGCHWTLGPNKPFRQSYPINDTTLNPVYVGLVQRKINTVISGHYIYWSHINSCPHKDFIQTDQCIINLWSTNYNRIQKDFLLKHHKPHQDNLYPLRSIIDQIQDELNRPYNCYIDIERCWNDWNYLNDKLKTIDIHLDKCYYDEYLKIKGS